MFAVSGCTFEVLGIEPPARQPGDASVTQDLAQASEDLGSSPGDMAAAPADMVMPADLFGCVTVAESFASDPKSRWSLLQDATWSGTLGRVRLNTVAFTKAGGIFLKKAEVTAGFDASFRYSATGGTGADGLALVFAEATAPNQITVPGNGGGGGEGWKIGYVGNTGFAVEIDTYDSGGGDPGGNHVGFMKLSDGSHLASAELSASLRGTHLVRVRYTGSHVTVWIDGTQALDSALAPPAASPTYLFGFTAATGGLTDNHDVWDFSATIGPPGCY